MNVGARPGRLAAIVLALGVALASLPCAVGADPVEQGGARLDLLSSHDLGGNGLHADIWLHRGVAYVGTGAEDSDRARGCPGTGVKAVDLVDPASQRAR